MLAQGVVILQVGMDRADRKQIGTDKPRPSNSFSAVISSMA
jgi:hypothetical protein